MMRIATHPSGIQHAVRQRMAELAGGVVGGLWGGLGGVLYLGLIPGVLGALASGCVFGLSGSEVERRTAPNQGIWRSAKNALRVWLAVGLVFGVGLGFMGALADSLVGEHNSGLAFWFLNFGFPFAFFLLAPPLALARGGLACIQHLVLRLILWWGEDAPLHYVPFLDYATERVFLRKVGGATLPTSRSHARRTQRRARYDAVRELLAYRLKARPVGIESLKIACAQVMELPPVWATVERTEDTFGICEKRVVGTMWCFMK